MKRTASDASLTRKTPKAKRKVVYPMSPALQMQVDREVRKEIDRKTNKRIYDLVQNTPTNVTYSGSVYSLTAGIARGDLDTNFEGNTIFPKWLQIRWRVANPPGVVVNTADNIRLIVGQQIRASTVPTAANLLQYTGVVGASLSPKNNDYSNSFKILYDQLMPLDNFQNGNASNTISGNIFISGRKLAPIEFIAANTTPVVGDLFIAFFGEQPAAGNNPMLQMFFSRIKFSN